MLTLKSLTLQNIGRYLEPQTIDFTSLGSLVQVDGDSGVGKSMIFKAHDWLLGLDGPSTNLLQSRLTKDQITVSAIYDYDGQSLRIERGKKLLIDINGTVTTGSSKTTEELLDQIIGMPRSLFSKMLHKSQDSKGFFLDLGPSGTHTFLTNCLGLQKEQAKIVTLDTKLKGLEKLEISLKSSYESHQSALQATLNAISSIGHPPVLDIDPDLVVELEKWHTVHKEFLNTLRDYHKKELADLEAQRPVYISAPFDRSAITFVEGEIGKIQEKISELNRAEEARQLSLKSKIADLRIEASKLGSVELTRQSAVKSKIQELHIAISNINNSEQSRQAEVKYKILSNRTEYGRSLASIEAGNKAKEQASILMKELQKVRASMCPTCEQSWITDAAKIKEGTILTELGFLKKQVVTGMESQEALKTIDLDHERLLLEAIPRDPPEIENLTLQYNQLKIQVHPLPIPELIILNAQMDQLRVESQPRVVPEVLEHKLEIDFKTSILNNLRKDETDHQFKESAKQQLMVVNYTKIQTELRASHEVTIHSAQAKESEALQNLQAAQNKVRSFEQAKLRFDESHEKLTSQLIQYREKSDLTHQELLVIQEEIELATEAQKAIKSYLSCSFEDALDSIGDAATRFIRNIPNMSTATIQFEGLKETKEGKVKEEVTCSLSVDGDLQVPIKSLSGGERSSTDLAIDLAVMEFIQERSGTGCNLLVLDEPFNGLNEKNITPILEFLRESATNKQILIVDHNPFSKELFESKITVIRDGQTSKVVQQ